MLGTQLCTTMSFVITTVGLLRAYSMVLLALDSFLLVFAPISYPERRKKIIGTLLLLSEQKKKIIGTLLLLSERRKKIIGTLLLLSERRKKIIGNLLLLSERKKKIIGTLLLLSERRKKIIGTLLLLSWFGATVISMLPLILDCYGYRFVLSMCLVDPSCHFACRTYDIIYWTFILFLPSLVPLVLYILLFWKAMKLKRSSSSASSASGQVDYGVMVTFFLIFMCAFLITMPVNYIVMVSHIVLLSLKQPIMSQLFLLPA